MVLPIVAYGHPVLRKKGKDISPDHEGLKELISNMFETMYEANGVGLAAPQIGKSLRLFVIDASPFANDEDAEDDERVTSDLKDFKKVFINPQIVEEWGDEWAFEEGCLSIPEIRENVSREDTIKLKWQDENFKEHEQEFSGYAARVIQHEYDHIEGVLFTDKISPLRKNLIRNKLANISKGKIAPSYRMKFYTKPRRR